MGTSTFFSLASIKVSVILVCTLGDFIISNTMFPVKLRHEKWDRRELSRTCKLKHIFPRPCGFDLFFSENSTSCPIQCAGYILTCDVQIKKKILCSLDTHLQLSTTIIIQSAKGRTFLQHRTFLQD